MTIGSIEKVFIEDLTPLYGRDEAASLAWLTISFICQINRTKYLSEKNEDLNEHELSALQKVLTDLKKSIPLQYILGETEFYGLDFKVNPSVLIPRPETEELVDWILKDANDLNYKDLEISILDIGTGSGCIPITLKLFLPYAQISAIDISPEALKTAKENAHLNNVQINFIQDDILKPEGISKEAYSIIVSNPPYVTLREKKDMHANVLDHEPHLALFVPNEDPLIFYNAIADFAVSHLKHPGFLFLEINENLGNQTVQLLKYKGFYNIQLKKDLRGNDRMIKAQLNT